MSINQLAFSDHKGFTELVPTLGWKERTYVGSTQQREGPQEV